MSNHLTASEKQEIIQLAKNGYAVKEIAPLTGRSNSTVTNLLKTNGIKAVKKYPKGCFENRIERKPENIEREQKIVELRKQNISYRQISKMLNMNQGTVCTIAKKHGLDGMRAQEVNGWKDPNDFLRKYNPNLEYVSGWKSVDDYAVIRFKDCSHEYECSMKTVRSHPEYRCKVCADIKRREETHQRNMERIAERNRRLREKQEEFWNRPFEQNELRVCPVCRNIFYGKRTYCSEKCQRYKATQNHHDRRQQIIKERTKDKDITLKGLYERYDGVCHICGGRCDWNDYQISDGVHIAGDNYPSIDHIVELANGGEHSWANIKLAHRHCNWERWLEKQK